MNFPADALESAPSTAPPLSRHEDAHPDRVHYTHEFHIYQKPRSNGPGLAKRARCNHCAGDWAYNETRLKHHIIDPFRGCRRIPADARERVRLTDSATPSVSTTLPLTQSASTTHAPLPSQKHKREPTALPTSSLPLHSHPVVSVPTEPELSVPPPPAPTNSQSAHVRVAVEFSMTSGTLMRATWIAAELISEFHRNIIDVGLIPRSSDNTFNIWIGGKIAWSRGVGQPLPDYDHLRPIVRAQCCNATL